MSNDNFIFLQKSYKNIDGLNKNIAWKNTTVRPLYNF